MLFFGRGWWEIHFRGVFKVDGQVVRGLRSWVVEFWIAGLFGFKNFFLGDCWLGLGTVCSTSFVDMVSFEDLFGKSLGFVLR